MNNRQIIRATSLKNAENIVQMSGNVARKCKFT